MQSVGTSQSPSSTPTQPRHEARRVSMATTVRTARLRQHSRLLIRPRNAWYPHSLALGRRHLSPETPTRAQDVVLYKATGGGDTSAPHLRPHTHLTSLGTRESRYSNHIPPPSSEMLPRCPAGWLSGCRPGHLTTRIGTGVGRWKSPDESTRAREGGEVPTRCSPRQRGLHATRTFLHSYAPSLG